MTKKQKLNEQIVREASHWAVRIDGDDLKSGERRELAHWLKASPVHVDELLGAMSFLYAIGEIDAEKRIDVDTLIFKTSGVVVPLEGDRRSQSRTGRLVGALSRNGLRVAGVACIAVAVGWLALSSSEMNLPAEDSLVVETAIGEQREVLLSDGSKVRLNTNTRLVVNLGPEQRLAELDHGEAFFDVNPARRATFEVRAGPVSAQALGTKFNVKYLAHQATISVTEGKVAVGMPSDAADPDSQVAEVLLTVGEQVHWSPTNPLSAKQRIDPLLPPRWQTGKLVFEGGALDLIASEFNRYNRRQLVVADAIADERFSGVFDATDPASFAQYLESTDRFSANRTPDRILIEPVVSNP